MKDKPYKQSSNTQGFGRLGYCCSVDVLMQSFARIRVFSNDPTKPQYEPEEKTHRRIQEAIDKILTRAEIKPVFFVTRSDTEEWFEKRLLELPEFFTRCTQTPTSHTSFGEHHTVSVWVAHKHNMSIPNQISGTGVFPQQVVEEGILT